MRRRNLKIRSKYNINEEFSYNNIPSNFESVTDSAIRNVKYYSLYSVRDLNPDYPVSALKAMIISVAGNYNSLLATLAGDFASRKNKLDRAYAEGVADLKDMLMNLDLLIANHNNAFENFNEVSEELLGRKLSSSLYFSAEERQKIADKIDELEKK